jgi:hypothetical protein
MITARGSMTRRSAGGTIASWSLSKLPFESTTALKSPTLTSQGFKWTNTTNFGRFAGRWVPWLGWAWTAHDVLRLTVPPYDQFHVDFKKAQQLPGSGPTYMGSDGIYVCFVAGTKIYTNKGVVNIETLREGMKVYSYNLKSNQVELKPVIKFFKRNVQEVYSITVGKEDINVTSEHPFFVEGKGWIKVKDLEEGDLLITAKGKTKRIINITKKTIAVNVYNIEVEGNHNFYVTGTKILVHNK